MSKTQVKLAQISQLLSPTAYIQIPDPKAQAKPAKKQAQVAGLSEDISVEDALEQPKQQPRKERKTQQQVDLEHLIGDFTLSGKGEASDQELASNKELASRRNTALIRYLFQHPEHDTLRESLFPGEPLKADQQELQQGITQKFTELNDQYHYFKKDVYAYSQAVQDFEKWTAIHDQAAQDLKKVRGVFKSVQGLEKENPLYKQAEQDLEKEKAVYQQVLQDFEKEKAICQPVLKEYQLYQQALAEYQLCYKACEYVD